MRVLIFSDTHNSPDRMLDVMEWEEDVDAVIHLGDGAQDAELLQQRYPRIPVYWVGGNCDFGSFEPAEGLIPLGGVLVYYTHGHMHNVKQDLTTLWRTARDRGARVALFGHTHTPYHKLFQEVHLFNPGSLNMPRSAGLGSYGILTIEDGEPSFDFCGYQAEG